MGIADFTITADPSSNAGYDATAGEVLTLQLENLPATDVYRVQWSVSQYSKDMPAITFSPVSGEPATPGGTVTATCPASGTHSLIIDCLVNNGVDQNGVTQASYQSARCVVIRSPGGLGKIVPAERTEYDTANGWTGRVNEMIDEVELLASATSDPVANTLVLRDDPGAGAGFGYVWTGSTPAASGQIRLTNGNSIVADNGSSTDVTLITQTAGAIEIGDALDAASIAMYAQSNGNISATASGAGTVGLIASGAGSFVSVITNGATVLSATGGAISLARVSAVRAIDDAAADAIDLVSKDVGDIVRVGEDTDALGIRLSVATGGFTDFNFNGTAALRVTATGLAFGNAVDGTIDVNSVAAGGGKNLLFNAGDVTAGAGDGGSIGLYPGTNAGGATGNVVCVMPIAGGTSGMFKLNDGTTNFLDAKATAALATFTFDRETQFDAGDDVIINVATGGAGDFIVKRNSTEIVRAKSTGLEFPTNSANAILAQAASSSPQSLTIRGAAATGAGVDGSHVLLEVGDAGSAADDAGEIKFNLKLSNGVSGIWRMRAPGAAVGDEIATFQHTDATGTSLWSHPGTLTTSAGAMNLTVSDDAFITAATTNAQNVAMFGTGDAGDGAGVLFVGNASAVPTTNPTAGFIIYGDAGAGKVRGSGGTVTTFGPAEPHCPRCGADFIVGEWVNEGMGKKLTICGPCMITTMETAGLDVSSFVFVREGI